MDLGPPALLEEYAGGLARMRRYLLGVL